MPHKDLEARRAYMRAYRQAHPRPMTPEEAERHRARERARYHEMKQDPVWLAREMERKRSDPKSKVRSREWRMLQMRTDPEGHRKKARANQARWAKQNPEKAKMKWLRSRLQRRGMRSLSADTVQQIVARWGWECAWCGRTRVKLELDHVVAVVAGGRSVSENLVLACRTCNASKGKHPWEQWFKAQPFFTTRRARRVRFLMHSPDVLDAMPGRVTVVADEYGSRAEVA